MKIICESFHGIIVNKNIESTTPVAGSNVPALGLDSVTLDG